MQVYRVYEVEIHTAQMIDETGTNYTLTPSDPSSNDGRYYAEVTHRGRVFDFADGALIEVYETQLGEPAFRCQRLGEEHIYFGDELLDQRGHSIDSLIGRTRTQQPDDEIVEDTRELVS